MPLCKHLKGIARRHERMADFFSLLAFLLLFSSIFLGAAYYSLLLTWIGSDPILHLPVAIALLALDLFLILTCLNIGSARYGEVDESCFHTFSGRRSGSGSVGLMFNSWLHHIEQVGRKHR